MAIIGHAMALNRRTNLPTDDPASEAMTRCLAVLVSCSNALDQLFQDAVTGNVAKSEQAIFDLLVSLNAICDGDGKQLRLDTDLIAARLGCHIVIAEAPPTANMH